jgi:hypothetical protein
MRHRIFPFTLAACIAVLGACGDAGTAPDEAEPFSGMAGLSAGRHQTPGKTVAWNETGRQLIADHGVTAADIQGRILSYLSLAQYNAIVEAERTKDQGRRASPAAAAAGASVAVLTSFFPDDAAMLEAALDAQVPAGSPAGHGSQRDDTAWGEEIGRAVGADIVAYASMDEFGVRDPGAAPIGTGFWYSIAPTTPVRRSLFGARPFFLTSGSQFRASPPPTFGSADFLAGLAEIRTLSDNRTAEQVAIAKLWGPRGPAWLNEIAVELMESHHWDDRKAARLLALANMAGFDAQIGCFDSKFAYWFIRPTQADPAITLAISLPNHPSYISAHSCIAASYVAVLEHAFPEARARLDGYVELAGLSRMYGGLHYRFDVRAGQELGRRVAEWAIAHDVTGHEPFVLD